MRATPLLTRSALIGWARSRRSSGARGPWTLKNWLAANHSLRALSRTTLHGSGSRRALHRRTVLRSAGCGGARRWCCVYRTRTSLRRDHSPLLHNRLPRHGLARRRSRRSRRTRRGGGWSSRCFWLRRWWRSCCCWRMYGRRDHNRGRTSRLFDRRRRYHSRRHRLDQGRCDHSTSFRCWCSRFRRNNGWFLRRWRRCRRRRFYGRYRCSRFGGNGRRPGRRRGWMLLFLLSLSEQFHYIARLGDLGKVDLRFYFRSGRPLPRRGARLGGKVLAYTFRFILLNRA
jgi:hypothetical protein